MSLVPSDCDRSNAADSEAKQILSSMINLDPYSCRRSFVDLEETNWIFSLHNTLELPDINSITVDREVMTVHAVNDPFHYMSIPVLSAFGCLGLFSRIQ